MRAGHKFKNVQERQATAISMLKAKKPLGIITKKTGYMQRTILELAAKNKMPGASTKSWQISTQKLIQHAKEEGAKSISDLHRIFPNFKRSSILTIAARMNLPGASTELEKEIVTKRELRQFSQALDSLNAGKNINTLPINDAVKMAAGETFVAELTQRGISAKDAFAALRKRGFSKEEVEAIAKEI